MLRQRVLTALVLVPLLLVVVLWLPDAFTLAVIALMILIGAWEWSAFLRTSRTPLRALYVLLVAAMMALLWQASDDPVRLRWILAGTFIWWAVAFTWVCLLPACVNRSTAAAAGLFALAPSWTALGRLHLTEPSGNELVLFLLALVWSADIGAYFAGRRLGRVKLAPRVSPGKTWEGVLGGLGASAAVAVSGAWYFAGVSWPFFLLCLGVVLASVVGDLTESMFKRFAGMKDSGSVFPGHGGVLDRIDSLTAAAPVMLLGLGWLGMA